MRIAPLAAVAALAACGPEIVESDEGTTGDPFDCPQLLDALALDPAFECALWSPYAGQLGPIVDGVPEDLTTEAQVVSWSPPDEWPMDAEGPAWLATSTAPGPAILDVAAPAWLRSEVEQASVGNVVVGLYATLSTQDLCAGLSTPLGPAIGVPQAYGHVHVAPTEISEPYDRIHWDVPRCVVGGEAVGSEIAFSFVDNGTIMAIIGPGPLRFGVHGALVLVVEPGGGG